jgi:uncharacterized membrane protein YjjB (DUF3815 family)
MLIDQALLHTLAVDALWSALAAFGFGVLLNAPRRALFGCALLGAAGHGVRTFALEAGASLEGATLIGAFTVGVLAWVLARWFRIPAVIFSICGAVPLMPGTFAYRTVLSLIQITRVTDDPAGLELLMRAVENFTRTTTTLAALAVGIAAPTLFLRRRRPVV